MRIIFIDDISIEEILQSSKPFIAVYARVSTDKQFENGISVDNQLDMCLKYIKKNCDVNDDVIVFNEEDASSQSNKRDKYKKMFQLIEDGIIKEIVSIDLFRINRLLTKNLELFELCIKENIKITTLSQPIRLETPEDKMSALITAIFGNYHLEKTSFDTKRHLTSALKRGLYVIANTPYGYIKTSDKKLIKDNKTESVVNEIITKYINTDVSKNLLAKIYNLDYSIIDKILEKGIYRGYLIRDDEKIFITEPYITKDTDKQIKVKKSLLERNNINIYLFKDKLKCSECGSTLQCCAANKKNKTYLYYRCSDKKCINRKKYLNEERLENRYKNEISSILSNIINLDLASEESKNLDKYKQLLKNLESKEKKLVTLLLNNKISQKVYDDKFSELKSTKGNLSKKINKFIIKNNKNKYFVASLIRDNFSEKIINFDNF